VRVYPDLLRSLHDKGLRHVFLVSGHQGGRDLMAMARIAEEASRQIETAGMTAIQAAVGNESTAPGRISQVRTNESLCPD
jgi:creatinine amidohydrolase/Fe(II)-dependent formamide hydrolase-like protein